MKSRAIWIQNFLSLYKHWLLDCIFRKENQKTRTVLCSCIGFVALASHEHQNINSNSSSSLVRLNVEGKKNFALTSTLRLSANLTLCSLQCLVLEIMMPCVKMKKDTFLLTEMVNILLTFSIT